MNERVARFALAALVLLGPIVLGVKLFSDAPAVPDSPRAAKSSLIVITASTWPEGPVAHPALEALELRAGSVREFRAPSPSSAATAATLWTGRWPTNHGVISDDFALAPGTWTLAEAARRTGLRTFAILDEPLASRHAIDGFQQVREVEQPVEAMAQDARRAIEEAGDHDFVLWLHVADAGPGGRKIGELLAACESALAERYDQFDAAILVTAFRRSGDAPLEERLVVPFWIQLPARLFGGEQGNGIAQHTDPCGVFLRMLRWEVPLPAQGENRDQSRTPMLYFALRGGNAERWYVIETPEGHTVRDVSGTTGIHYLCRGPGRPPLPRDELEILQLDDNGQWIPVAPDLLEAVYRGHYDPRVRAFNRQATPAVPVGDQ